MTRPQHQPPTLGGIALRALRRHPQRTAFSWDGGELSYAATVELIGRYQAVFERRGLARGARIAILSTNRAESWCANTAAHLSGLSVTWLQALGSTADHLRQMADAEVDALIVDEKYLPARGLELAEALAGSVAVFSCGPSEFGIDLADQAADAGAHPPVDVAGPDDLALINYTGGTSGIPKGVVRRHRAAGAMFAGAVLAGFEIPTAPRYLAVAPMSHVGGTKFLPVLLGGGTIHLVPRFDPDMMLATIQDRRITMTLLVPTMIYALLDNPRIDRTDLSSLELVLYGASAISPSRLSEALQRIGPVFSQFYGQTECYPIAALHRRDHRIDDSDLLTSCGVPVPTAEVQLLDDDGNPVPDGEPGEICVRSPTAMDEYWRQPDLTAATLTDGWLRTGDIARSDDRGFLYIADRKKEMIITGGFNVYPREVEDALTDHHAIAQAAVFGVPDEHWGETVVAAVVLREGATVDAAGLCEYVKSRKGAVQTPKRVVFMPELPKTLLGKIDKKALRATVQAEQTT